MAALALTGLLAILWIALIGVGYRHGGWRQIVLLAAMLLSYAVLSEWAAPNGRDLAARFHWSVARATTGVALLYLLFGTLILGLAGSFALYRPRPLGLVERRLGALMGLLNGGLLLALVLRTLRSYAYAPGRGQALHESVLSRFLIEDVGYLLLGALLLGGVAAIVGLLAARRDEARERALLDAVALPVAATPAVEHERPALPVPSLPAPHIVPPTPPPVYATAPVIDWPASPPPGIRSAPPATEPHRRPDTPKGAMPTDTARSPLPARPQIPPRIPPPMVYPVADLIAAHAKPATHAANGPPAVSPPAPSPSQPLPLPGAVVSTPATGTPKPARPIGPPPGAANPAFVPPPVPRPSSLTVSPGTAHADVAPESPPSSPPVEESPPVVRKLDVATQDVPIVRGDAADAPLPDTTRDESKPDKGGEAMRVATHKPVTTPPPNVMQETAAISTIVPPRLPPMPPGRAASSGPESRTPTDEATKARPGFARVAVARQAGGRPEETGPAQPHPATPPEPLQPPLPTGPRVHPCPTCGYPVRDHARYCANCGARQGR